MYNPSTQQPGIQFSTTYVHDSYAWMAVKTGLPGSVALLTLDWLVFFRAYRLATRGPRSECGSAPWGVFPPSGHWPWSR